jgi:hypothetical protein
MCAGAADFTYTEQTQLTGGTLSALTGLAARFSRDAAQPKPTVHQYTGDVHKSQTGNTATITNLSKEVIVVVDYDKREYSTITFAEMAEAMKKMMANLNQNAARQQRQQEGRPVTASWKIEVNNTGQTKEFLGVNASQQIIKASAESTDAQSGNQAAMDVTIDSWRGNVRGYDTVKAFQKRMAARMAQGLDPGMGSAALAMLGASVQGLTEAQKKLGELDGMALFEVTRVGGTAAGAPAGQGGQAQPQQPEQQSQGIGGAIGRLGGLGRLGRRKQDQPKQEAPAQGGGGGGGLLMESTRQVVSWSADAISPDFDKVPAGFKQVDHPMKRWLEK